MKQFVTLLFVVVALAFSGCGKKVKAGIVCAKRFDAGTVIYSPVRIGDTVYMQPHFVPDSWIVCVSDGQRVSEHSVSEEFYNSVTNFQHVSLE